VIKSMFNDAHRHPLYDENKKQILDEAFCTTFAVYKANI